MSSILRVKNISKKYNTIKGEIDAIKDISLDIDKGDFVAIVGPSGCGKSTLLSIIANLIEPSSGEIEYAIDNPTIGYMLQEDALFEHYNVLDNVLLGLKIKGNLSDDSKNKVLDLLKKYNLDDYKYKKPHELSGGMKQRVG